MGQMYVFGGQGNLIGEQNAPGSYFPISDQVERFVEVRALGRGATCCTSEKLQLGCASVRVCECEGVWVWIQ